MSGPGFETGGAPFVGVMTSVYVRHDGEWKLAVYQQTPRPDDAAWTGGRSAAPVPVGP